MVGVVRQLVVRRISARINDNGSCCGCRCRRRSSGRIRLTGVVHQACRRCGPSLTARRPLAIDARAKG